MFDGLSSFLERYGWYCLLGAGIFFLIYQKYLHDKVQSMYADRELVRQKKHDEDQQDKYREQMEQARKKMQEDYAKEVEHKLELEKAKAQQRKNLKLGINDEQEEAPKVRFDALQYVREQIVLKPVVVFSKSWCPYSRKAKQVLIGTYRIDPKHYNVIELDEHEHGELIQDALQRVTGGRSVPRVFIQGNFIGGGDDTEKLHRESKLAPMLKAASVIFVE